MKVKCPKCGNDDLGQICHVEDIIAVRRLREYSDDGTLLISGHYDCCDENGTDERLFCCLCNVDFPIPEGLEVDFV